MMDEGESVPLRRRLMERRYRNTRGIEAHENNM